MQFEKNLGFGSGFNQVSGSGSRRAKMIHNSRSSIQPKMMDPDPYQMNTDPKP
jgi:hypothetical protein